MLMSSTILSYQTEVNILLHMKNPKSLVTTLLFDMDNTLFDLFEAQVAACQAVVELVGNDEGNELFSYFFITCPWV